MRVWGIDDETLYMNFFTSTPLTTKIRAGPRPRPKAPQQQQNFLRKKAQNFIKIL